MAAPKKSEVEAPAIAKGERGKSEFVVQPGHRMRHGRDYFTEGQVMSLSDGEALPGITSGALLELKRK